MLYTPMPGTPLHEKSLREGSLLFEVPYADIHGQFKFNFRHPKISRDESKLLLDWAFRRDYERNGPSVYRLFKTMLAGWRRYLPTHRLLPPALAGSPFQRNHRSPGTTMA
jgi:hypothetical protein